MKEKENETIHPTYATPPFWYLQCWRETFVSAHGEYVYAYACEHHVYASAQMFIFFKVSEDFFFYIYVAGGRGKEYNETFTFPSCH